MVLIEGSESRPYPQWPTTNLPDHILDIVPVGIRNRHLLYTSEIDGFISDFVHGGIAHSEFPIRVYYAMSEKTISLVFPRVRCFRTWVPKMANNSRPTRRQFIKAATATGAATGFIGTTVAQNQQVATSFLLGGDTSGWVGREPSSISGTTNPPLRLEAGQQYEVTWVNVDGAPHNFVVQNGQGDTLVRTEIISDEGARQTVTFTAEAAMTEYYCQAHPNSMRGPVELTGQAGGQQNATATTEVDTITTSGSSQAGQAGQVDAADDTTTATGGTMETTPPVQAEENATQTTTPAQTTGNATTGNVTTETKTNIGTFTAAPNQSNLHAQTDSQSSDILPRFDALTTFAGIAGVSAFLFGRKSDDSE